MTRLFFSFTPSDIKLFKRQLLNYGSGFSNFCFLEGNGYSSHSYIEAIAAFGAIDEFSIGEKDLSELSEFVSNRRDWIFGHISYDLKNQFEDLHSANPDRIGFSDCSFFIPEIVVSFSGDQVQIGAISHEKANLAYEQIQKAPLYQKPQHRIQLNSRFSKEEYLQAVQKLKEHIAAGDCFEACLCQEFYAEDVALDPVVVFEKLNTISPNPFASFYKNGDSYLLCASPERFLKKVGNTLFSQPIKGTLKRTKPGTQSDILEKNSLYQNAKERSENIMIIDLVRNDLSRICDRNSVRVTEFCQIYSFPQVHQMISTVAGSIDKSVSFVEILAATFPMGSMTGAPKLKAMELLEKYENSRRGLFSGSVGYFTPDGDFDLNVVIRSVLYNSETKYLSVPAGSAIISKSKAENEYEECLLKISAICQAL